MKIRNNKKTAIAIVVLLTISMGASLLLTPNANAHTPPMSIPSIAFCNAGPNPAGIGQSVTIGFWIDIPPVTASGPLGDRYGPMTIHITAPDGTNSTLGPFVSDDTGGTSTHFTPSQIGTYTIQMTYPGQVLTGISENPIAVGHPSTSVYVNDTMTSAVSNIVTLEVQEAAVPLIPNTPLPTSYWQTPINAINVVNWAPIGGAYLNLGGGYSAGSPGGKYNYTSNYQPYSTAPTTSHIIWTMPVSFGGALGGPFPASTTYGNYYSTSQYERKYNPIVINGYIYYTQFPGSSTTPAANVCVNLYNGQTVWTDDSNNFGGGSSVQSALTTAGMVTSLKCGQVLSFNSPNQFGGLAYLWTTGNLAGINTLAGSTMWNMFDAMTGKYILSIVNGTSPSVLTTDATGDLIGYYTNTTAGAQYIDGPINPTTGPARVQVTNPAGGELIQVWNSTQCIMAGAWSAQAAGWEWRPPQNGQELFSYGIMAAAPIATTYQGNALPTGSYAIWTLDSGDVILDSALAGGGSEGGYIIYTGYSLSTFQQLWAENISFTPDCYISLNDNWLGGNGVWLTNNDDTGQLIGYSMTSGKVLWTDNLSPRNPYDSNGHSQGTIVGNNLILFEFGGDIWSINMQTGVINWYTNTTALQGPAGDNTPYAIWPIWEQCGDGVMGSGSNAVLFIEEGHEYSPPLFLGAQQLSLNETTGQLLSKIDSFNVDSDPVMAYGVMTILNAYDNQVYAYAMGPSKTTISAPSVGVTTSTPITITGAVTDISAGASQEAVAANFPNGLPCVSDASMSQFMEAVYMQQPMPNNDTGVPVNLSVLDSNGNFRTIGTTITNGLGDYSYTWTPDIPGNFTVYATFAGTQSYYASSASVGFHASSPPATLAPTVTSPTGLASNNTLMYGIVAIAIIIIVIGAVLALLVTRKHP